MSASTGLPWVGWWQSPLGGWLIAARGETRQAVQETFARLSIDGGHVTALPAGEVPQDVVRDHEGYVLPRYTAWISSWDTPGVWIDLGTRHGQQPAWDLITPAMRLDPWWQHKLVMPFGRHPRETLTT